MDRKIKKVAKNLTKLGICRQSYNDACFMSLAASNLKSKKVIVEIGMAHGGSLVLLCLSAMDSHVYSIDIDSRNNEKIIKLCDSYGIDRSQYTLLTGNSIGISKQWNKDIDCLLIDGDHSYSGVYNDLCNFVPFVNAGGIVLMHDCPDSKWRKQRKHYRDSRKALKKYNKNNPTGILKTIGTCDIMRLLIKK